MIDFNKLVKHSKVCSECPGFRIRKEAAQKKSVRTDLPKKSTLEMERLSLN